VKSLGMTGWVILEFSNKPLAFENYKAHNKAMKNPMTINAQQLELLQDFTTFPILQIFTEPSNPSQVAKSLNMPANTMHYRVKKLHEAGLLKMVSQKGRRRSYQSVATNFRVRKSLLQRLEPSVNPISKDALSKVARGYDAALAEHVQKHLTDEMNPYVHFGIEDEGYQTISDYEPCFAVYEMPISKSDYKELTQTLIEMTNNYKNKNPKEKHCTVAIVAFSKSSAFPTLR
jgi:DNA-binding Lrp family transcriptional regulator